MMDNGTPRPWINEGNGWIAVDDPDNKDANGHGVPIARVRGAQESQIDANAALIVRAVNRDHLFDELVAALDGLLRALSMGPLEVATSFGPDTHPDRPVIDAAERARAILAKIDEASS